MPASWQLCPKSAAKTWPGKSSNHQHEIWTLEMKVTSWTTPSPDKPRKFWYSSLSPFAWLASCLLSSDIFIGLPFNSEAFSGVELMPDMMLVKGRYGYLGSIILYKLFYYFFQSLHINLAKPFLQSSSSYSPTKEKYQARRPKKIPHQDWDLLNFASLIHWWL